MDLHSKEKCLLCSLFLFLVIQRVWFALLIPAELGADVFIRLAIVLKFQVTIETLYSQRLGLFSLFGSNNNNNICL